MNPQCFNFDHSVLKCRRGSAAVYDTELCYAEAAPYCHSSQTVPSHWVHRVVFSMPKRKPA